MVAYHLLVLLLSVMHIENRSFVNGLKHDGLSPIISLEEPVLLTSPTDRKNKASVRANKIEISILKRQIQEQQNFIRNLQEKSEAGLGKMNLRLVNGNSSREGRVEVYKDGVWGTVCDNGWDFNDAKIVCKQLFGLDGIPYSHAYFGQGTGLVLMDDVGCNGTESSLLQCDHKDNLHHSCDHSKDAGVICMKAPLIRLSKQKELQGRVEVYINNTWGTICDTDWGYNDASVVCRSLGYSEQGLAVSSTVFGIGSGPIHLDNVQCSGRETGLADCPYSDTHSCSHSEDVGVLCILPSQKLRVVNGSSPDEGLVEVFVNDRWRRVCNNWWDRVDSNVACRSLGYSGGFQISLPTVGESGKDVLFLDKMDCNGDEDSLLKCARSVSTRCSYEAGVICYQTLNSQIRIGNGSSSDDGLVEVMVNERWRRVCGGTGWGNTEANVTCRSLGFPRGIPVSMPNQRDGIKDIWLLPDIECRGDETTLLDCVASGSGRCSEEVEAGVLCYPSSKNTVRFVNGSSPHEGLVEVFMNHQWRRVCGISFGTDEANVICKGLNYSGGIPVSVRTQTNKENYLWKLIFSHCEGNENSLLECEARGTRSFGYNEDARVICYPSKKGEVRLVNGDSPDEGLFLVLVNGHWRSFCAKEWDKKDADVACRSLGFLGGLPISFPGTFRNNRENIWFFDWSMDCDGSENSLLECAGWGSPSCTNSAGVICYKSSTATVRLVDGRLPNEGIVEVLVNGRWRSVCESMWDKSEAYVTCGLLGYSGGIPVSLPRQRNPTKGIWRLPRMQCRGDEDSLLKCPSDANSPCFNDGEAGVICYHTSNGTVRIVNGSLPHEGVVEILVNGRWRTICCLGWDKNSADITCRRLNYTGGIPLTFPSPRNRREEVWGLQYLGCNGNEDSLLKCDLSGMARCRHHDDAGVSCYKSFNATVRLVNGTSPHEGVVEIFAQDQWRSICNSNWEKSDANVTCRSLGYLGGFPVSVPTPYEEKEEMWFFSKMGCNGNEESLSECASEVSKTCYTGKRAGALCYDSFNGTVRLTDGFSPNEGIVEVLVNNQWRRIRAERSERKNAIVTCRSLGYSGGVPVSLSSSQERENPVWLLPPFDCRNWGCERSLLDCQYNCKKLGYERSLLDCRLYPRSGIESDQEAGVHCYHTINDMTKLIRLVNGTSSNEGRVEMFINGTWGSVCHYGWNDNAAKVLCRTLGYTGDNTVQKSAYFGQGSGTAWIRWISCGGRESSIFSCYYPNIRKTYCSRDAGVRCK